MEERGRVAVAATATTVAAFAGDREKEEEEGHAVLLPTTYHTQSDTLWRRRFAQNYRHRAEVEVEVGTRAAPPLFSYN